MSNINNAEGIDWFDSGVQVKLRLTNDAEILKSRKRDRSTWQKNKFTGAEELVLRHNTREYRFGLETEMAVPAPVAHGLLNSSATIIGEDMLTGDFAPALEIVTHWNLGQPEPGVRSRPSCPECGDEFATAKLLAGHIMSAHADEPPVVTPNMDAHLKGKKVPAGV